MEVLDTIFDYYILETVLWYYSIQLVQEGHSGADDQMFVLVWQCTNRLGTGFKLYNEARQ